MKGGGVVGADCELGDWMAGCGSKGLLEEDVA